MRLWPFCCDSCPECCTKNVQPDFDEDGEGELRPHVCRECVEPTDLNDYPITPGTTYRGPLRALPADVAAIRANDPALHSRLELILYPSLWLLFFQRLSHVFYNLHLFFFARLLNTLARSVLGADLHPGAVIYPGVFIDHALGVVIGESSIIGSGTLIYQGATIGGTGHATDAGKRRHPLIGEDCVIGAGAKVLGSITVGRGVRVGAGAVLLKDTAAFTTMVGIPARAVSGRLTGVRGGKLEHTLLPDVAAQYDAKVDTVCVLLDELLRSLRRPGGVGEALAHAQPELVRQLEECAAQSRTALDARADSPLRQGAADE